MKLPLFASAGRAMSESGDWLTPKVNGMFRLISLLYILANGFFTHYRKTRFGIVMGQSRQDSLQLWDLCF